MKDPVEKPDQPAKGVAGRAAEKRTRLSTRHSTGRSAAGRSGRETASTTAASAPDGRSTRWAEHRRQKRRELVAAALRAIRRQGAGVGLEEIAAQAGTSKTVIYRYFGDRTGLWAAVVESVHDYILGNLDVPLTLKRTNPIQLVVELADVYLSLVERDPEVYRFVVNVPAGDNPVGNPVGGITARIGEMVAENIRNHLREVDMPEERLGLADTWGHGIVGFIWAVADNWQATGMQRPREAVVADVSTLISAALQPITPGAEVPDSTAAFIQRVTAGDADSGSTSAHSDVPAPSDVP